MANVNENSFESFLEEWLVRQHQYLHQLCTIVQHQGNENEMRGLVERVLLHYQQYYQAKARAVREDVFLMFSPPWFSMFERTFLWIAGFKPSLLFRIVNKSVNDLTQGQLERMERLKAEVKVVEKQMNDEYVRVQESVTAGHLVQMALRERGERLDGDVAGFEEAFERMREAMQLVVENADLLRMSTARDVVEVLRDDQALRFLAAATNLQLKIRVCGRQRQ